MLFYGEFLENKRSIIYGRATDCYCKEKWGGAKIRGLGKDLSVGFQITISCIILLFYTLNNVVLA